MRRVGVEEAAAIGAEHLDRDLRGHRADCNGLLCAFQRRRFNIAGKRLRHALPDQEQRKDDADWQQDVERAACDIDRCGRRPKLGITILETTRPKG
jgi:hypothetical protein